MRFITRFGVRSIATISTKSVMVVLMIAASTFLMVSADAVSRAVDRARENTVHSIMGTEISLLISSTPETVTGTNTDTEFDASTFEPGEPFQVDTLHLKDVSPIDYRLVKQISETDGVLSRFDSLLLVCTSLSGQAPPRIVVPEITVEPLSNAEKQEIERLLAADKDYAAMEQKLSSLRQATSDDTSDRKRLAEMNELAKRLIDREFSYYPERFKRFASEELRPTMVHAKEENFAVLGIESMDSNPLTPKTAIQGRLLTRTDRSVVVLERGFAVRHDYKVGQSLNLKGHDWQIVGIVSNGTGLTSADVFMPLSDLQGLAGIDGINLIAVRTTGPKAVSRVKNITSGANTVHVTEPSSASVRLIAAAQSIGFLSKSQANVFRWLLFVGSAAVAATLILHSLNRRRYDVAVLRVLGWPTFLVFGVILIETIVEVLVGGALGIGASLIAAAVMSRFPLEAVAEIRMAELGPMRSIVTTIAPSVTWAFAIGVVCVAILWCSAVALLWVNRQSTKSLAEELVSDSE